MARTVTEVRMRKRRGAIQLLGMSQSDRGSKYILGQVEIPLAGKSKEQINEEVKKAIASWLGVS